MTDKGAEFDAAHPGLRARLVGSGDPHCAKLARLATRRGWLSDLELISANAALRRAAAAAPADGGGGYVGTVGEPITLTLTIVRLLRFGHTAGRAEYTSHVHVMRAGADTVVYRGGAVLGAEGDTVTVRATVKEHAVRDGTRQTVLARPKLLP